MEKIVIGKIYINRTKQDGTPLISKTGKPYISVVIYPQDRPSEKISGFAWDETSPMLKWKVGDSVNVVIEQKGQWINFRIPKKEDLFEDRLSFLEQKVVRIQSQLEKKEISKTIPKIVNENGFEPSDMYPAVSDEIADEEVPF